MIYYYMNNWNVQMSNWHIPVMYVYPWHIFFKIPSPEFQRIYEPIRHTAKHDPTQHTRQVQVARPLKNVGAVLKETLNFKLRRFPRSVGWGVPLCALPLFVLFFFCKSRMGHVLVTLSGIERLRARISVDGLLIVLTRHSLFRLNAPALVWAVP